MTYDRVDWHRGELEQMRAAGIDAALPVYRADNASKQRFSQRGLITLAGALRALRAEGRDYPLIALCLETQSLAPPAGRLDLSQEPGRARLYAAIKDFFLHIPRPFRLAVPLEQENGGGVACVAVLSSPEPFAGADSGFVDYCRRRFRADFDSDLILLGASAFKAAGAALDGYLNSAAGGPLQMDDSGWIKPASISPGRDSRHDTLGERRRDGEFYRDQWRQAVARKPDWVVIDAWNDFTHGSEIAPSLESGLQFVDMTRVFTRAFAGGAALRAAFLSHTIPAIARSGGSYAVTVQVVNAGAAPWTPEGFVLAFQWEGTPGGTVPLPRTVIPGQTITFALTLPAPAGQDPGTLLLQMAQVDRKGTAIPFAAGDVLRVRVPRAGEVPAAAATLVRSDLATTVEAGGVYTARVTLRNAGSAPWKRAEGARIGARLWRYVSPINGTGEQESSEPVEMADASVELPGDVPPGQEVSVSIPVVFSLPDSTPITPWSQTDNWIYQIRWEYRPGSAGEEGAVTDPETLAVVDADGGAQFILDLTPAQLPAERRIPVKIGLRNAGPQTWLKDGVRVGAHWHYLDGVEAVWEDVTTPLPMDVPPGGEVPEMLAWVTAPPHDGLYWLVWDVKIGDTWASTLPGARAGDTRVRTVQVVRGRLQMVDLSRAYNLDALSSDTNRGDGAFDSTGRSIPAELVPPFATGPVAPSTLWLPSQGVGVDSSRRLSFRWGPKLDGERNFLECAGQRVPFVASAARSEAFKAIHLLAAATKPGLIAPFTVVFADGTQQLTSLPISAWDREPTHGEETAFLAGHTHTKAGDDPERPARLFRYSIPIAESKRVAALVLPSMPEVRIAAITLER